MKSIVQLLLAFIPVLSFSQNNPTKTEGSINGLIDNINIKLFSIQAGGVKVETDGTRAKFGPTYCACVDADDAKKFMASGIENISLLREATSLVIEARPYITTTDTLFLQMDGMNIGGSYEFQITPSNFDTSVAMCKVFDHFLNTDTSISLSSVSTLPFDVTAVTGSDASDRFLIVFYAATLPLNTLTASAFRQNNNVIVNWQNAAESNIKTYTIQKSIDGISFNKIYTTNAVNGSKTNAYSFVDNNPTKGNNFYRIQSTTFNNNERFSNTLVVNLQPQTIKQISVYPNPIKSGSFSVQLNNMPAAKYAIKLLNTIGQQVYSSSIQHNGSNGSISLQLNNKPATGSYTLQLINTKGEMISNNIIIQ